MLLSNPLSPRPQIKPIHSSHPHPHPPRVVSLFDTSAASRLLRSDSSSRRRSSSSLSFNGSLGMNWSHKTWSVPHLFLVPEKHGRVRNKHEQTRMPLEIFLKLREFGWCYEGGHGVCSMRSWNILQSLESNRLGFAREIQHLRRTWD